MKNKPTVINEETIRNIVSESVKRILSEESFIFPRWDKQKNGIGFAETDGTKNRGTGEDGNGGAINGQNDDGIKNEIESIYKQFCGVYRNYTNPNVAHKYQTMSRLTSAMESAREALFHLVNICDNM